jgi:hypothetical protein
VDGWQLWDTLGDLRLAQVLTGHPVSFGSTDLRVTGSESARPALRIDDLFPHYSVVGRVAYADEANWVLDVGISVACNRIVQLPERAELGSLLMGDVELVLLTAGVWGEAIFRPPAPPLCFDWQITRILLDTTPRLEWIDDDGTRHGLGRDPDAPISFEEIESTDINADGADDRYDYLVLDCELVGGPYPLA